MRAIQITAISKPLNLREVGRPDPGLDEVLVRITAAGICHSDVHYRDGIGQIGELPLTPGHEIAGVIEYCGDGVTRFRPGDRVCLHYLVTCGRCKYCQSGLEQWCESVEMLGKDRDGGYAEFIVVPVANAIPIPDNVSDEHAAVMTCSSATSLHAIRKARLTAGESVAVFGCGGLGMSAIQIARIVGASVVFAVDLDPAKLQAAAAAGAIPIAASHADPVALIRAHTNGRGVDVALELIGHPTVMKQALQSLAIKGRLAIAGITQSPFEVDSYRELIGKEAEIVGVSDHHLAEIEQLLAWASAGKLSLDRVVDSTIQLEDEAVNRVLEALHDGRGRTRIVIKP